MKVRALIVDDELHAREGIRIRLDGFSSVEIVGECSSGAEAVAVIDDLHPDLLFLDVQMPEMSGFEVLQKISADPMPIVIFVTAYDKYAVKAFEFHALDYLLKPISEERFGETIRLALSQINQRTLGAYAKNLREMVSDYLSLAGDERDLTASRQSAGAPEFLDRLAIKTREHVTMLPVAEIDWIESAGDYVYVHSNSHKHILRETLSSLEKRIDPKKFVRIHRSTIVNVEGITSLRPNDHGDFEVHLKTGETLKLSRFFRSHFQEVIGNSF